MDDLTLTDEDRAKQRAELNARVRQNDAAILANEEQICGPNHHREVSPAQRRAYRAGLAAGAKQEREALGAQIADWQRQANLYMAERDTLRIEVGRLYARLDIAEEKGKMEK